MFYIFLICLVIGACVCFCSIDKGNPTILAILEGIASSVLFALILSVGSVCYFKQFGGIL